MMDDKVTMRCALEQARARLDGKPYVVVRHSEDLDPDGLFGYELDRVESFDSYAAALRFAQELEADAVARHGHPKERHGIAMPDPFEYPGPARDPGTLSIPKSALPGFKYPDGTEPRWAPEPAERTRTPSQNSVVRPGGQYMRFERGWCSRIDVRIEIREVPSGRIVDEFLPTCFDEYEVRGWLLQQVRADEIGNG